MRKGQSKRTRAYKVKRVDIKKCKEKERDGLDEIAKNNRVRKKAKKECIKKARK